MEWQPIDTIPLRTPVLITDGEYIVVAERHYYSREDAFYSYGFDGHDWDWVFNEDNVTHWMPLPELPDSVHKEG